jgi:hypothetical protein
MPKRIALELEEEVRSLAGTGHGLREIGRMVGCSRHAIVNALARVVKPGGMAAWDPSPARLSLREREEIRVGLEGHETFTAIALRIGRVVSTGVAGGRRERRPRRLSSMARP